MIYGIGLPKTGTAVLVEALRILGYRGRSSCILTSVRTQDDITCSFPRQFSVNNGSFKFPQMYFTQDANFILTVRDKETWAKNVYKADSDIVIGREWPWIDEWTKTIKERIPSHKLLIIDWTTCKDYNCNWKRLCEFLIEPIPDKEFPK